MLKNILPLLLAFTTLAATAQQKNANQPKPVPKPEEKIDYERIGSPMPPLLLVTLDTFPPGKKQDKLIKRTPGLMRSPQNTKVYSDKYFDNNANLIVMMFNPTCGHCEDQADRFSGKIDSFGKTRLILLANQQMKVYLPNFIKNHHTTDHPAVMTVGYDSTDFIKNTFLYQALPQINIYSPDRKLIRTFSGNVQMDTLMQYMR